jgi:hypothetical protein
MNCIPSDMSSSYNKEFPANLLYEDRLHWKHRDELCAKQTSDNYHYFQYELLATEHYEGEYVYTVCLT